MKGGDDLDGCWETKLLQFCLNLLRKFGHNKLHRGGSSVECKPIAQQLALVMDELECQCVVRYSKKIVMVLMDYSQRVVSSL